FLALIAYFIARCAGVVVLNKIDFSFKKYSVAIATMMPRGLISTVVLFLPAEKGITIPYLVETVFILVLLSNVITLFGAFASERRPGWRASPKIVGVSNNPKSGK
ncbi:MAG: hypothetical protein V1717_04240, partial [Candidatus Micrarchaeota archaeon]